MAAFYRGPVINANPVVYSVPAHAAVPTPPPPSSSSLAGASLPTALTPQEVYDFIRDIKDPEHPYTLEQLKVVAPDLIWVEDQPEQIFIRIEYTPTVPHCSLATLIGLCLRQKLTLVIDKPFKLDIYVTKGKHSTEAEINKQVNDKERVAAALENPSLRPIVDGCIGGST